MRLIDGLLAGAVAVGILIALVGLVDVGGVALDEATAARVNEISIPADELQSLLERRAQEGAPVDQLLRTLDDMIDEELLIQRASELGILRRDSNVRVAIIQAMEKSILNEARGLTFPEDEVRAFYGDHPELFAEPLMLEVEEIVVADADRVASLTSALRDGAALRILAADDAAVSVSRLPPVPLSLDALERRFPDEVVTGLGTAEEGDILTYASDRGIHLVRVNARVDARVPPFEEVRLSALNELQMQRQDAAYDDYLAWLRQRAEILKNERLAP